MGNLSTDFVIYVVGLGGVYKSTNGTNFTILTSTTGNSPTNAAGNLTTITLNPSNRDIVYACNNGGGLPGVWLFTPSVPGSTTGVWGRLAYGTATGTKKIDKIAAMDVNPANTAQMALVTDYNDVSDQTSATGVWLSSDSGANWYQRNDGIAVTRGKRIRYSPTGDRLVMGSNGGGFYLAKTDGSALDYVQTRSADADTYVRDGASSTNFGTTDPSNLLVKKDSGNFNRFAFLRFTIQDVGQTITSAKVRLYGSRAAGTVNPTLSIYPVSDVGWDETAVTFANPPNGVGIAAIGVPTTITTTAQYYEWDVTSYILQQLNAGLVQMSFVIKSNTTVPVETVTFNSDEASTNKPQLVIRTDW